MSTKLLKFKHRLTCPACHIRVRFQAATDGLGTCPSCGEWLAQHGLFPRITVRLNEEPGKDFDDTDAWEKALTREINSR